MSTLKQSEILKAALVLFGPNGQNWTQGEMARDDNGVKTFDKHKATYFCSLGAVSMVSTRKLVPSGSSDSSFSLAMDTLNETLKGKGPMWLWQDELGRTFHEVKAKFLEAIKAAEKNEASSEHN